MPKFKVCLDKKHTMWYRATAEIEADYLEEAQEKLIKATQGEIYEESLTSEWLYETSEPLTRTENLVLAELDIYTAGSYLTEEELNNYPVEEFEETLNYEI